MRLRPTKMLVPFADHLGVKLSSRVKSLNRGQPYTQIAVSCHALEKCLMGGPKESAAHSVIDRK